MTFCETIDNVTRDLSKSFTTLWTPPRGERGAVGFFCAEADGEDTPRAGKADPSPKGISGASQAHGGLADPDGGEGGGKVAVLGGGKITSDVHEHRWGMPDDMIHAISPAEQKALLHQQTQQELYQNEGNLGLINRWVDRQCQSESQMAGVPSHRRQKKVERMGEKTAQVRQALQLEKAKKQSESSLTAPAFMEFSERQSQAYKNVWRRTGVSPEEHSQVVRELQCRGRTQGEERQRLAVQASIMDKKLLKQGDMKNDFTVFRGGGVYGHGQERKQIAQAEAEFEVQSLNPWANRLATIAGVEIFR